MDNVYNNIPLNVAIEDICTVDLIDLKTDDTDTNKITSICQFTA